MGRSNYVAVGEEVEKVERTAFGADVHNEMFFYSRNYSSRVGLIISVSHFLTPSS